MLPRRKKMSCKYLQDIFCVIFLLLKQPRNIAVAVHINIICGRGFRQSRHRHNIARERDNKACARRQPQFTHGQGKAARRAQKRGIVRQRILCFGNANRLIAFAECFNIRQILFRLRGEYHTVRAVDFLCNRFEFFGNGQRCIIQRMVV